MINASTVAIEIFGQYVGRNSLLYKDDTTEGDLVEMRNNASKWSKLYKLVRTYGFTYYHSLPLLFLLSTKFLVSDESFSDWTLHVHILFTWFKLTKKIRGTMIRKQEFKVFSTMARCGGGWVDGGAGIPQVFQRVFNQGTLTNNLSGDWTNRVCESHCLWSAIAVQVALLPPTIGQSSATPRTNSPKVRKEFAMGCQGMNGVSFGRHGPPMTRV